MNTPYEFSPGMPAHTGACRGLENSSTLRHACRTGVYQAQETANETTYAAPAGTPAAGYDRYGQGSGTKGSATSASVPTAPPAGGQIMSKQDKSAQTALEAAPKTLVGDIAAKVAKMDAAVIRSATLATAADVVATLAMVDDMPSGRALTAAAGLALLARCETPETVRALLGGYRHPGDVPSVRGYVGSALPTPSKRVKGVKPNATDAAWAKAIGSAAKSAGRAMVYAAVSLYRAEDGALTFASLLQTMQVRLLTSVEDGSLPSLRQALATADAMVKSGQGVIDTTAVIVDPFAAPPTPAEKAAQEAAKVQANAKAATALAAEAAVKLARQAIGRIKPADLIGVLDRLRQSAGLAADFEADLNNAATVLDGCLRVEAELPEALAGAAVPVV